MKLNKKLLLTSAGSLAILGITPIVVVACSVNPDTTTKPVTSVDTTEVHAALASLPTSYVVSEKTSLDTLASTATLADLSTTEFMKTDENFIKDGTTDANGIKYT